MWLLDGDGLFVTANGGGSWQRIVPPSSGDPLADYVAVDFLSLQTGWAVTLWHDEGVSVNRTKDGGATWQSTQLPASLFPQGFSGGSISFANASDGWVDVEPFESATQPTGPVLLRSVDGGGSWQVAAQSVPVTSIQFVSPEDGWGLNSTGSALYKTTDGGVTWVEVELPFRADVPGAGGWQTITMPVFFGRDGVVLAVAAGGVAAVEVTDDGGATWSPRSVPFRGEFPQPSSSAQIAEPFAVTSATNWTYWAGAVLYETSNRGVSWASFKPTLEVPRLVALFLKIGGEDHSTTSVIPIQFSSASNGWALATAPDPLMLSTHDGGHHFSMFSQPTGPLPIGPG